jgi:hypothetical protein
MDGNDVHEGKILDSAEAEQRQGKSINFHWRLFASTFFLVSELDYLLNCFDY